MGAPPEHDDVQYGTDPARIDVGLVHAFLSTSYWAQGRSRATVEESIRNSLCFGAYVGNAQVAFARVVTLSTSVCRTTGCVTYATASRARTTIVPAISAIASIADR